MRCVEGLRPSQVDLLARHRERALDVLPPAAAAYEGNVRLRDTAEGQALLAQPPDLLVSVAMSSAAAAVERRRLQQSLASAGEVVQLEAADAFPGEVLRALRRRRLPFRPDDVVLLLDLGTSTLKRDRVFEQSFETVSLAVSAATQLLRGPEGSGAAPGGARSFGLAIDALELPPTSEAGELRRRIHALLAANVPGGMLDLSVLDARDAWATEAEEVLRRHSESWDGVQRLVALPARASGARPTAAWRSEATEAAEHCESFGLSSRSSSSRSCGSTSPPPASPGRRDGSSRPATR